MEGIKEVFSLSNHVGYSEYLKPYVKSNIKNLEGKLKRGEFESIADLKETQAELKAYENVVSYVEKRVEERIKN